MTKKIQMVNLKDQYLNIKAEIDTAIQEVINSTGFINGQAVKDFRKNLAEYLNVPHVITCGNGTDALQIAMMALDLQPGDEVIVPAFTYVATAEVIGLLKLVPVMVDCDYRTFNVDCDEIEKAITPRTKAIVPVNLFGQSADMEQIMKIAEKHNLYVIEDNAQAIGAEYIYSNKKRKKTGTIGHIGCFSFFPSKNLGCYGDGGAIATKDDALAQKLQMIASHGQEKKYYHKCIGVNSRLDTIQAAILNVKLKRLNDYNQARKNAANYYTQNLKNIDGITIPYHANYSTHVFHQYTLIIEKFDRNKLKEFLQEKNIPAMIYYPLPLSQQEAFKPIAKISGNLENTCNLCKKVLSLPIHTELTTNQQELIIDAIKEFRGVS